MKYYYSHFKFLFFIKTLIFLSINVNFIIANFLLDEREKYNSYIDRIIDEKYKSKVSNFSDKEKLEKKKLQAFEELQTSIGSLVNTSQKLYGTRSVFRDYAFISENDNILRGSTFGFVKPGEHKIEIKSIAQGHEIASAPIDKDIKIPSGEIVFLLEDKKLLVDFKGGNLTDFKNTLETVSKNNGIEGFNLFIIKYSDKKKVLLLKSEKTGKDNFIKVEKDNNGILSKLRLFRLQQTQIKEDKKLKWTITKPNKQTNNPNSQFNVIKLNHGEKAHTDIEKSLKKGDQIWFDIIYQITLVDKPDIYDINNKHQITDAITINFEDLSFFSGSLSSFPDERLEEIKVIKDNHDQANQLKKNIAQEINLVFSLKKDGKISFVPYSILLNHEKQKIKLSLDNILELKENNNPIFSKLELSHQNPQSKIILGQIKYIQSSISSDSKYIAFNTIKNPQDAEISYQGISVFRKSNKINDLIPGVILDIKRAHQYPIDFKIQQNKEIILNQTIDFFSKYNVLMGKLNLFLAYGDVPVDLDEKERDLYGIMRSEYLVRSIKNRLRRMMSSPYIVTTPENHKKFFNSIGVTNLFFRGENLENNKIEIEEVKYQETLNTASEIIADLFGADTNKDGIVDSGLGVQIVNNFRTFSGVASPFSIQKENIKNKIVNLKRSKEREEEKIAKERGKLERQFTEIAISQQEAKRLNDNFNAFRNNNK